MIFILNPNHLDTISSQLTLPEVWFLPHLPAFSAADHRPPWTKKTVAVSQLSITGTIILLKQEETSKYAKETATLQMYQSLPGDLSVYPNDH